MERQFIDEFSRVLINCSLYKEQCGIYFALTSIGHDEIHLFQTSFHEEPCRSSERLADTELPDTHYCAAPGRCARVQLFPTATDQNTFGASCVALSSIIEPPDDDFTFCFPTQLFRGLFD